MGTAEEVDGIRLRDKKVTVFQVGLKIFGSYTKETPAGFHVSDSWQGEGCKSLRKAVFPLERSPSRGTSRGPWKAQSIAVDYRLFF